RVTFRSDMVWAGSADGETILKLRPQSNKVDYSFIDIVGEHNGLIENITFDANSEKHVNLSGNCEGIDFDSGSSGWLMWGLTVKNASQDGFDHDNSEDNYHIHCTVESANKDGFHN